MKLAAPVPCTSVYFWPPGRGAHEISGAGARVYLHIYFCIWAYLCVYVHACGYMSIYLHILRFICVCLRIMGYAGIHLRISVCFCMFAGPRWDAGAPGLTEVAGRVDFWDAEVGPGKRV